MATWGVGGGREHVGSSGAAGRMHGLSVNAIPDGRFGGSVRPGFEVG